MRAQRNVLIAFLLLFPTLLLGQSTSQQISGFVTDPSGAFMPGVEVTARQLATGFTRSALTNDTGYYVILNVPIGDYDIAAEMPGFSRSVKSGVKVTVNAKLTVTIPLKIGEVSQSVTVMSDAAMVEATTGEIGRLVAGEQVSRLQLNGRNFAQLLALLPGVSSNARSSFELFGRNGSVMNSQSVNGGRPYNQSWNVDGADNKDNGGGGNNFVNVNPDAIAEFRVLTSNYGAEYGQNGGAVVNLALKSGSNNFHGLLYEFVRNDAFDARAFNTLRKQKLRYNNFGGNLAGPLVKDKLFFFGALDFRALRGEATQTLTVPTMAQRGGDFSALAQSKWPKDPLTGKAFPGGIIPATRFSPNAKRLIDNYPEPNFSGSGGNFVFQSPRPQDTNQHILKLDYNLSEKHQLAVHYMADAYGSLENSDALITLDRNTAGSNISARWTWAIDGSTVNTFQSTVSGNAIAQVGFKPNPVFISDFTRAGQGIDYPMLFNASDAIPSITITGFAALTARPIEFQNFNRLFSWKDDFSKLVGKHNFKFGALVQRSRKNQDNPPTINGSFAFSSGTALHSGNALADALLGNFYTYNEGGLGSEGWFRFTQAELYAGDNWKIVPRLSVDLGARFALMQPQYAALNNAVVFSPRFYDPSKAPIVSPTDGQITPDSGDPTNGLAVGGSEFPEAAYQRNPNLKDLVYQSLFRGLPKEITHYDTGTFGPRIGFALDLTGRQQTVLRGGYGMFFERIHGNFIFTKVNNPPFISGGMIYSGKVDDPAGGTKREFPAPVTSFDPGAKVPTIQNWSLNLQQKLMADMMIDLAYVGSNGYNQYRGLNLNQLPAGTVQKNKGVNVNALRPYPGYADITQSLTNANSNYHSMQLQVRKDFSGGGLVNLAYTWSKSITDSSGWNDQAMDSYNPALDRSLTAFDRRHILVLSYVYPLPFWQQQSSWYKKALGGWQVSGITTLQTGLPINVRVQGDVAGTGVTGQQRPNQVGDWRLKDSERTITRWFNTSAFENPAAGTFGNVGRNAITGPGTNNWDLSLQKLIAVNEKVKTEVRIEIYNLPNHLSYYAIGSTLGSASFGQVTQAGDPRILQFCVRLQF